MTERYDYSQSMLQDALEALAQMKLKGHAVQDNGVCSESCEACLPLRTTPDLELQTICSLLRSHGLTERGHIKQIEYGLHQTRLEVLALHPRAKVERLPKLQAVLCVTLELPAHDAPDEALTTVLVRGLLPMQGNDAGYTHETLPKRLGKQPVEYTSERSLSEKP